MPCFDHAGIVFRDFSPGDQAAARALVLAGLAERFGFLDESLNPDLSDIQAHYIAPGGRFIVAECGGQLIATGALSLAADVDCLAGRLERISVDARYRRRGIGRAVVGQLIAIARTAGIRRLYIETEPDWHDAIALYAAFGFRSVGPAGAGAHFILDL